MCYSYGTIRSRATPLFSLGRCMVLSKQKSSLGARILIFVESLVQRVDLFMNETSVIRPILGLLANKQN